MARVLISVFLIIFFSCSTNEHCKPGVPQQFMTLKMSNNGFISYGHYLLIAGLSKACDSITVMSAIKNYVESNGKDLPIGSIDVYNSIEHYDTGETLSQPKEFFADCVVEVWFDEKSGKPRKFYFFDSNGKSNYEGVRWKQ